MRLIANHAPRWARFHLKLLLPVLFSVGCFGTASIQATTTVHEVASLAPILGLIAVGAASEMLRHRRKLVPVKQFASLGWLGERPFRFGTAVSFPEGITRRPPFGR